MHMTVWQVLGTCLVVTALLLAFIELRGPTLREDAKHVYRSLTSPTYRRAMRSITRREDEWGASLRTFLTINSKNIH